MPESIFELQAELCKTMANVARLKIVHSLRQGPKQACNIAQEAELEPAKVSQHLAILRAHGLVTVERCGRNLVYEIANQKIVHVCDLMRQVLLEQAAERSEILQAMRK